MKIAFISPKGGFFENYKNNQEVWKDISNIPFWRNFYSGFSTGLLIMAAITPESFKLKLIDENFDRIDFNEDFDLVAITGMTQQATRAYEIADTFRKKRKKVVMGGIHATVMPEEAKQHVDSVIIGEGEGLWPEFLKDFLRNDIKPFYRTSNLIDLTQSPIPRYDLLNKNNYNVVWVQATRGCPIDCEFCAASKIYGLKFRHKKVEQVIDEIKYIINIFGRRIFISFADDNMFVDRKYAFKLVEKLVDLKIRWFAQTDISIAEDNIFLKLLRKSGCSFLFIGFETLNKKGFLNLDRNNWKSRKSGNYREYIKKVQSHGIGIVGAFILGLDTDTISVFKKTADFINSTCLYSAQISILTPLPGTRLRDRFRKENRLLPLGWDNFTFVKAVYMPNRMSVEELESGLLKVYKKVYSEEARRKRARYFKNVYLTLNK